MSQVDKDTVMLISDLHDPRTPLFGERERVVEAGEAYGHSWSSLNYVRLADGSGKLRIVFDDEIFSLSPLQENE